MDTCVVFRCGFIDGRDTHRYTRKYRSIPHDCAPHGDVNRSKYEARMLLGTNSLRGEY